MSEHRPHPDMASLSLYAGGDLRWFERLPVARHVSRCPSCRRRVEAFGHDRDAVRAVSADLPDGLDWDRLAAEMTANIRVGLAAGECVGGARRSHAWLPHLGWKPVAAFASVAVLFAAGWWFGDGSGGVRQFRSYPFARPAAVEAGLSVGSALDGIEVKQDGAMLKMMNPGGRPALVTASTQGVVRARYVDADTGQVTIANVYAE